MQNPTATFPAVNEQLAGLVDEMTRQLEAGEPIDLSELGRQHPEHIESLRKLLPALEGLVLAGQTNRHEPQVEGDGHSAGVERRLGDFRLIREIGRGGMGVIYEAEQITMGRRVALKVLPFAAIAHDKSLQRFRNEVRAAAALDHPHIVSVYSIGEERGVHYYAMQLIRGQSLADVISQMCELRDGKLPVEEVPISYALLTGGVRPMDAAVCNSVDAPTTGGSIRQPSSTQADEQPASARPWIRGIPRRFFAQPRGRASKRAKPCSTRTTWGCYIATSSQVI